MQKYWYLDNFCGFLFCVKNNKIKLLENEFIKKYTFVIENLNILNGFNDDLLKVDYLDLSSLKNFPLNFNDEITQTTKQKIFSHLKAANSVGLQKNTFEFLSTINFYDLKKFILERNNIAQKYFNEFKNDEYRLKYYKNYIRNLDYFLYKKSQNTQLVFYNKPVKIQYKIYKKQKTGRVSPERKCFNFSGIKKENRKMLKTLNDTNLISLDAKSADLNSIIFWNLDKFNKFYKNCKDIHKYNAQLFFNKKNVDDNQIKKIKEKFIKSIYGYYNGEFINTRLHEPFKIFCEVRDELCKKFYDGEFFEFSQYYEQELFCFKYCVGKNVSKGKILALFAQTVTTQRFFTGAMVIEDFLIKNKYKTKILFTIHDEMILEIFPEEFSVLSVIKNKFEKRTGFNCEVKNWS